MQRELMIFVVGSLTGMIALLLFVSNSGVIVVEQILGPVEFRMGMANVKHVMALFIATSLAMILFWVYA